MVLAAFDALGALYSLKQVATQKFFIIIMSSKLIKYLPVKTNSKVTQFEHFVVFMTQKNVVTSKKGIQSSDL